MRTGGSQLCRNDLSVLVCHSVLLGQRPLMSSCVLRYDFQWGATPHRKWRCKIHFKRSLQRNVLLKEDLRSLVTFRWTTRWRDYALAQDVYNVEPTWPVLFWPMDRLFHILRLLRLLRLSSVDSFERLRA